MAAAAALSSSVAFAAPIFSNPIQLPAFGDCSFSTTCAGMFGRGNDFAAQKFTLSNTTVLTAADFIELDFGTTPSDVNWGLIAADGTGGSPGTILAAGTDTLSALSVGSSNGYNLSQMSWNLGTVALGPGDYYLAMQGISSTEFTYLAQGQLASGAYETEDGGLTWTQNYEGIPSVAVDLFGDVVNNGVPEPSTWLMGILGFGAIGAMLRRRPRHVAA